MKVNGTLMNYYFHCKRQCYLHGSRLNMEDNSEDVQIGKAIHEEKLKNAKQSELEIENIKIDKLTKEYVTEIKKSDADVTASKWQLFLYLSILKQKGVIRKGRLEFVEKKTKEKKVQILELTEEIENELNQYIREIEDLLAKESVPPVNKKAGCKKCAYYEYCYVV